MAPSVEKGQVNGCHTAGEFDEYTELSKQPERMVVVQFTAAWCRPCKIIAPLFLELAAECPDVIFLKVDVDELKAVAEKWDVQAMPTFIYFKDGKFFAQKCMVGAKKDELIKTTCRELAAAVAIA